MLFAILSLLPGFPSRLCHLQVALNHELEQQKNEAEKRVEELEDALREAAAGGSVNGKKNLCTRFCKSWVPKDKAFHFSQCGPEPLFSFSFGSPSVSGFTRDAGRRALAASEDKTLIADLQSRVSEQDRIIAHLQQQVSPFNLFSDLFSHQHFRPPYNHFPFFVVEVTGV